MVSIKRLKKEIKKSERVQDKSHYKILDEFGSLRYIHSDWSGRDGFRDIKNLQLKTIKRFLKKNMFENFYCEDFMKLYISKLKKFRLRVKKIKSEKFKSKKI